MKKSMMIAVAGLGLLLAGCATQSPYVGTWTGREKAGREEVTAKLTKEGIVMIETSDGEVVVGNWLITDDRKVEISVEGEDKKAIATLVDDDAMVLSEGKHSMKLTRQVPGKD